MSQQTLVDAERLRAEVREKYRAVAVDPAARYHFHTGRGLAARLGYDPAIVDALPQVAVESFAGVANPLALRTPAPGERVVDVFYVTDLMGAQITSPTRQAAIKRALVGLFAKADGEAKPKSG